MDEAIQLLLDALGHTVDRATMEGWPPEESGAFFGLMCGLSGISTGIEIEIEDTDYLHAFYQAHRWGQEALTRLMLENPESG